MYEALYERYQTLVKKAAFKLLFLRDYDTSSDYSDLYQDACLGFILGCSQYFKAYDNVYEHIFIPYVFSAMLNEIKRRMKYDTRSIENNRWDAFRDSSSRATSLNVPIYRDDFLEYADQLPDASVRPQIDLILEKESCRLLYRAVNALPEIQRAVVTMLYLEGQTVETTAAYLGLPEKDIRETNKQALRQLRKDPDLIEIHEASRERKQKRRRFVTEVW